MIAFKLPPLDEFKGKNEVSTVSLPLLFAVTLSIITSNIYTRLAVCNCISITFWSGDLPSPLMAIFFMSHLFCEMTNRKLECLSQYYMY